MDEQKRCLPMPSVSTFGVFWHLARWGYCSFAGGGLKNPSSQGACVELLVALLRQVGRGLSRPASAQIVLANKWFCSWPRPPTFSSSQVVVDLRIDE
eukprot:2808292-Alexandrium_andersonii.AAC.1